MDHAEIGREGGERVEAAVSGVSNTEPLRKKLESKKSPSSAQTQLGPFRIGTVTQLLCSVGSSTAQYLLLRYQSDAIRSMYKPP